MRIKLGRKDVSSDDIDGTAVEHRKGRAAFLEAGVERADATEAYVLLRTHQNREKS